MEGRELGCKLTGCLFGIVMIFGFFGLLMNFTDSTARTAMLKRQRLDVDMDLPVLYAGIRQYAQDHNDTLPPLRSAAEMKQAIFPKYVMIEDAFVRFGDKVAYEPNSVLSEGKLADLKKTPVPILLWEPKPAVAPASAKKEVEPPSRTVLYGNGNLSRIPETDWAAFQQTNHLP